MSISAPAVTEAMAPDGARRLREGGPGKALSLHAEGREIAEVMARRHRLLERWLTDTLGLNWTDAHEEAHRLEHALSPRVEDRLARCSGCRARARTATRVPGMARPPRVEPFPLAQAKEGATVVVERITRRPKPTRSCSSISGATRSDPGAVSRSSRSRHGPARSPPAVTAPPSHRAARRGQDLVYRPTDA